MGESVEFKGRRLLMEGRLNVTRVDPHKEVIVASCRGDSGETYKLGWDPIEAEWRCTCAARRKCSHLVALQLVTVRPKVREFANG